MSVAEVLELASKYRTDNFISKENLLNPTPDFVFKFYSEVLNDYNEKIVSIIGSEMKLDLNANPNFPPEFNLFRETAKFYKPLNLSFSLCDILRPAPKRTTMFVMHGIHFLSYVDSVLDSRINTINELFKQSDKFTNLQTEKQQLLVGINQCAEAIALCDKEHKTFTKTGDTIEQKYEKMMEEKSKRDKLLVEKNSELNSLKMQNESAEYKLKLLEDEERKLRKGIVSDNEFVSLKSMQNCLRQEEEQLKTHCDNLSDHLRSSKIDLQFSENCLILLESLEFNSANLNKLIDYGKDLDTLNNEGNLIESNLNSLKSAVKTKEDNVQVLKDKIKELNQQQEHLMEQLEIIIKESKGQLVMKSNDIQKKFEYQHKLEEIIRNLEASKVELLNDEKLLKEHVVNKYQHILNCLRKTVTTFNNMLIKQRDVGKNCS